LWHGGGAKRKKFGDVRGPLTLSTQAKNIAKYLAGQDPPWRFFLSDIFAWFFV